MGMEKRGVVDGENEAPVKLAADNECPLCSFAPYVGTDPLSKMAEAAAKREPAATGECPGDKSKQ